MQRLQNPTDEVGRRVRRSRRSTTFKDVAGIDHVRRARVTARAGRHRGGVCTWRCVLDVACCWARIADAPATGVLGAGRALHTT